MYIDVFVNLNNIVSTQTMNIIYKNYLYKFDEKQLLIEAIIIC